MSSRGRGWERTSGRWRRYSNVTERPRGQGIRALVLVCLDTNLLLTLLRGDDSAAKAVEDYEEAGKPLRMTAVTEYELVKGAYLSSKKEENLQRLRRLFDGTEILRPTDEACGEAAFIYSHLESRGKMINEFDVLIAGIVIANEETLVSSDEHFEVIEGLRLQSWK